MSISNPSASYFNQVAGQWDNLRSGYFTEAVRDSAIAKAYLRPEMVVADVGAGTGFLSAGLAPLVRRVYALDGVPAMLEVAKQNLKQFDNIVYEPADGLALPLPDDSLDAVFANMYLHHCPVPLAAIREMVRVLRPGGRIILTDMDSHPYAWLKEEMADIWQGFERSQLREWYREAGLVNLMINCTGTSCSAKSEAENRIGSSEQEANISIFIAVGTKLVNGVEKAVSEHYAGHAEGKTEASSCSSVPDSTCCGATDQVGFSFAQGYSASEKEAIPTEATEISLGCGNPTAIANLKLGEVVLDIGSGGGIDAFLSAGKVGKEGHVIGVDMTPAMIEKARSNALKGDFGQVEFRLGQAEKLPVDDASVDVVISNCVINLTPDKGKVFDEIYRVLKVGGRLEVSDMVTDSALPGDLRENPENWGGCVFGALPEGEYIDLLKQAGFGEISVRRSYVSGEVAGVRLYSALVSASKGNDISNEVQIISNGKTISSSCCGV